MPPAGLAATARCPGGYGIRPYAVGVDACIDSEPRRLPHVAFLGPLCEGGSARRRWGRELCGYPKFYGLWQGSLPPALRATSPASGGGFSDFQ